MEALFAGWGMQLLMTVGVLYAFGIAVWLFNKLFYRLLGNKAHGVCVATGIIGTPIHELGHAFFCVLFGHRIEEIKLFQPNDADGVLGYVSHSYNRRNVYQQVGNFFIGIGPLVFGTGVLMLLMVWLIPDVFTAVMSVNAVNSFEQAFAGVPVIFALDNLSNGLWWVFIVLACLVALHMRLSLADVKGSIVGVFILAILLLIYDAVVFFAFPPLFTATTSFLTSLGVTMISFMTIALSISVFMDALAIVLRILGSIFGR